MGLNDSTARTIWDTADTLCENDQTNKQKQTSTSLEFQNPSYDANEIMDRMLAKRTKHQNQKNVPLYREVIQETVSGLHKDVIKYGKKWDCLLQKAGLATAES
jgi:predicted  nucleic acid-binding Zn ribbon protein